MMHILYLSSILMLYSTYVDVLDQYYIMATDIQLLSQ